jgi:hypothetical protein
MKAQQTEDEILILVKALDCHCKARWKDSIKKLPAKKQAKAGVVILTQPRRFADRFS